MFLRCGDYLKFLMGLRKISTKICAQLHVFSLWRLTWVFDGPWENFHKKVCPVTRFFAVQTILNFWWDLKSFDKKMCPVTRFFSLWRLTWIFEGSRKNFHKKVCPVICFFAVETISSFLWDLEKFPQKCVPSYTFFRCGDYLKFLMGLRKISLEICAQLHVFSLWRLTWVFDGPWKKFWCAQLHVFFRSGD